MAVGAGARHAPPVRARLHCYACDKVASMCICDRVAAVDNRTGLTIVQDRREERHPFGTVRIARLGLSHLTTHVVDRGSEEFQLPIGAAVLFPDEGAPVLSALSDSERPRHLVVIDGTWAQASQLRRNHPALAPLPGVRLAPEGPSRYRIRREPHEQAVSTIEAIVRALKILEPETPGLDGLLTSFDSMIDDQLLRRSRHAYAPRHRHSPRIKKPLPEVFRRESEDVALVYIELHQPAGQAARFALRVTAARPHRCQLVDLLVRSPLPPSAQRTKNMELGSLCVDDALEPEEVTERLRALLRPTDTVVAWAQKTGPALRSLGVRQPFLSAKHHYANHVDGRVGSLDDVVAGLGGPRIEPWAPGRAGRQIAQLDRVVAAMRAGAVPGASSAPRAESGVSVP